MTTKTFAIASALLALIPAAITGATAHSGHHAMKTAATYHCAKCHMKFTAAKAKADHYKDPMDGGKLVRDKRQSSHSHPMKMKSGSMRKMKM